MCLSMPSSERIYIFLKVCKASGLDPSCAGAWEAQRMPRGKQSILERKSTGHFTGLSIQAAALNPRLFLTAF